MLGLNLGLGLGGRGGKRSRQAVFTWAGADSGTKHINFNADVKIRVTGTISLGLAGLTITEASGWVTVSPTAATYYEFTCSGNGDIVFSDARKVSYLSLNGTLISISGDIGKCTGLTCLYLSGTLISISGDIGKCTGLTYLYLNGTLISISGDIGNPLTTYIHNSSVNSSISVDVTLMTELTRLLGYDSNNTFYGTVNSKKLVVFQIMNSTAAPIDKRIIIPDGFSLDKVNLSGSSSWVYVGVHSSQRLPAIESERLMGAYAKVIDRLGAWDSRLIFSVRGADSDDPPSNDPLDADENGKTPYQRCMEHIQTIVNADRQVIVPAAWGWVIPLKEEA